MIEIVFILMWVFEVPDGVKSEYIQIESNQTISFKAMVSARVIPFYQMLLIYR